VLSLCLRGDPTAGAGGTSIRTIPTFVIVLGMVAEIERKFIRER
jgi:DNA invertase Pin-like site-specific DNA recombinase